MAALTEAVLLSSPIVSITRDDPNAGVRRAARGGASCRR